MTPETVLFYLFATGALASSIAVVAFRNPLMGALALIVDFFFFAGLYVLLSAHFMAVIQILVYGGAIMVLFMFIIMLLNLRDDELETMSFRFHHLLAIVVFVGFVGFALKSTTPIFDHGLINQNRAAVSEIEDPLIKTPSRIPGLFADLNEAGLEDEYQKELQRLASGDASSIDAKYRRSSKAPIVLPPVLKGQNARGGPLTSPPTFGTAETVSVLLVNRFVIPFELTAILLLAAIIGAVIIAKKRL